MTPWPDPHSAADGILDDETYDWLGVFDVLRRSGGRPVVVPETAISRAHELGRATGIPVSVTGTAGLAALLTPAAPPPPATHRRHLLRRRSVLNRSQGQIWP